MINPFAEINWNPEEKDFQSFGKSMIIGFGVISVIFLAVNLFKMPMEQAIIFPGYLFAIGGLLFFIAAIGGLPARIFYYIWFALAGTIGVIVSNILLAVFFYMFFSVFAVVFRTVSGRDPLALKKNPDKKSWWIEPSGDRSLKSYFKQY